MYPYVYIYSVCRCPPLACQSSYPTALLLLLLPMPPVLSRPLALYAPCSLWPDLCPLTNGVATPVMYIPMYTACVGVLLPPVSPPIPQPSSSSSFSSQCLLSLALNAVFPGPCPLTNGVACVVATPVMCPYVYCVCRCPRVTCQSSYPTALLRASPVLSPSLRVARPC